MCGNQGFTTERLKVRETVPIRALQYKKLQLLPKSRSKINMIVTGTPEISSRFQRVRVFGVFPAILHKRRSQQAYEDAHE